MHTDAYDALVNLKKYIRESSEEPLGRKNLGRDDFIRVINEFIQKAISVCSHCKHDLTDNQHGFDQNDGWIEGDNLVHSGVCTYCHLCNPRLPKPIRTKCRLCGHDGHRGTCKAFDKAGDICDC